MQTYPRLVAIVLNWNSPQDTLRCLQAAQQSSYPALHLMVVDNASDSGLESVLGQEFPQVHLLQNQTNLGYAAGNNVGIRWALEHGADYVLLLNDDITVQEDTCQRLIDAASRDPATAAVGGKIRPFGQPGMLWAAGQAFPRHDPLVRDEGQFDLPNQVGYAVGCCLLLSRCALEAVGLLAEEFFMLHEEKEWCYRAARAGFHIWYTPEAVAWHHLKDSFTARWSPAYHYLFVRNNLYFRQRACQIPGGWQRIGQALDLGLQEAAFIRRHGDQRLRRLQAAGRGVLDFLLGRFGPPPMGI